MWTLKIIKISFMPFLDDSSKNILRIFGDFDEYKRCAFDRLSTKSHSPMFFFCGTQDNVGFPLTTQTRFAQ